MRGLLKTLTTPDGEPIPVAATSGEWTRLVDTLQRYAVTIKPWAESIGAYMLADINRRNEKAWRQHGEDIGKGLRQTIEQTPLGGVFRGLLAEQVSLIQSIPQDAAKRVQAVVQENLYSGTRSSELAKQLADLQGVPAWRAKLIARTETSKASTALTQARALAMGSEGYIWRTSNDADVRDTHQKMEGKYVRWDTPPKTDKSLDPYHAGCGPNCRCYPEPVLPEY